MNKELNIVAQALEKASKKGAFSLSESYTIFEAIQKVAQKCNQMEVTKNKSEDTHKMEPSANRDVQHHAEPVPEGLKDDK